MSLRPRQRGQASIEFILLSVVIASLVLALFATFGQPIKDALTDVRTKLGDYIAGAPGDGGDDPAGNALVLAEFPDDWYKAERIPADNGPIGNTTSGGGGAPPPPPPPAAPDLVYNAPTYTAPGYTAPGYTAPGYTAPGYTAPGTGTPGSGGPGDAGVGGGGGPNAGAGPDAGSRGGGAATDDAGKAKTAGAGGGSKGGDQAGGKSDESAGGSGKIPKGGSYVDEEGNEWVYDEATQNYKRRSDAQAVLDDGASGKVRSKDGKKAKGQDRVEDRTRKVANYEFDWLTVLKIVIMLLLLVFILYIAIGAVRRRRGN